MNIRGNISGDLPTPQLQALVSPQILQGQHFWIVYFSLQRGIEKNFTQIFRM